jgi:hypothetical protein
MGGLALACPKGQYNDAAGDDARCQACPTGTTTAGANSTSAATCSVVLHGYGYSNAAAPSVMECPIGEQQNQPSSLFSTICSIFWWTLYKFAALRYSNETQPAGRGFAMLQHEVCLLSCKMDVHAFLQARTRRTRGPSSQAARQAPAQLAPATSSHLPPVQRLRPHAPVSACEAFALARGIRVSLRICCHVSHMCSRCETAALVMNEEPANMCC